MTWNSVKLQCVWQLMSMMLKCGFSTGAAELAKKGRSVLNIPRLAVGLAASSGLLWGFAILEALKV